MSNNDWKSRLGVVYSTNKEFQYTDRVDEEQESIPKANQKLRVWLDKKQRAGKQVSIVKGFVGSDDELKSLGSLLKSKCGVGGSVKEGEIIIQGDFRNKILEILTKEGYGAKMAGG